MKFTVQNNGDGYALIKVCVPESMLPAFMLFIENQKQQERKNQTPSVKKTASTIDENYLTRLHQSAKLFFDLSINSGSSVNTAVSVTLQKIKGVGFYNVTYDSIKSILAHQGCFRKSKS